MQFVIAITTTKYSQSVLTSLHRTFCSASSIRTLRISGKLKSKFRRVQLTVVRSPNHVKNRTFASNTDESIFVRFDNLNITPWRVDTQTSKARRKSRGTAHSSAGTGRERRQKGLGLITAHDEELPTRSVSKMRRVKIRIFRIKKNFNFSRLLTPFRTWCI